jgi:anti-sigma-K factor RskA
MTDKKWQFDDETCERYLLGELSEAEKEQFEEAYFADDALFEQFLAVKDELLDAFARGELAEEKRIRFAQHFQATAPRRRQIDEAQEFIRAVSAVSTKATATNDAPFLASKSKWRQSFANFFNLRSFARQFALVGLLLIALGGVWLFVRQRQQLAGDEQAAQKPTPAPTTATPTPINENNIANDNTTTPSPSPANGNQSPVHTNVAPQPTPRKPVERKPQISFAQFASIMLLPVASRDIGEANTLRLDSDTPAVRLRLVFKSDDYRNYSAAITTIEGASVWRQNKLKAKHKSVTLQFASALLSQQDYLVTLKGQTAAGQTEIVGEYYFHVERTQSQNTPKLQP